MKPTLPIFQNFPFQTRVYPGISSRKHSLEGSYTTGKLLAAFIHDHAYYQLWEGLLQGIKDQQHLNSTRK